MRRYILHVGCQQIRRQSLGQAGRNFVRPRKIHIFYNEVTDQCRRLWQRPSKLHHRFGGLNSFRRKRRPDGDSDPVLPMLRVEQFHRLAIRPAHFGGRPRQCGINLDPFLLVVFPQDRDDPCIRVDHRNHLNEDFPGALQCAGQVVHVVERANVAGPAQFADRLAGLVNHPLVHGGIEPNAGCCHHILRGIGRGLLHATRNPGKWLALRRRNRCAVDVRALVSEIRHGPDVGRRPLVLVPLDLPFLHDPWSLGRKRDQFRQCVAPVVKHPLRTFGMAHHARVGHAPLDVDFVTDHPHDRNRGAEPLPLHEDVFGRRLVPLDRGHATFALVNDLDLAALQVAARDVVQIVFPADMAVGQLHQRLGLVVQAEVLRDADFVLRRPRFHVVANAGLGIRHRISIGIFRFKLVTGHHFRDEPPARIGAGGVLRGRVQIHRERIADAPDHQRQVETIRRFPLGQDAPIPPAHRDRILERGVVGNISRAVPFDEPDQAAIHLRNLGITAIAHRGNVDAGPVLPLVVGDLVNERRQFVDRLAWPLVQTALRHDLGRPLLALLKLPIVQAVLAVLALRADGTLHALAHLLQDRLLVLRLAHLRAEDRTLVVQLYALGTDLVHRPIDGGQAHPALVCVNRH